MASRHFVCSATEAYKLNEFVPSLQIVNIFQNQFENGSFWV